MLSAATVKVVLLVYLFSVMESDGTAPWLWILWMTLPLRTADAAMRYCGWSIESAVPVPPKARALPINMPSRRACLVLHPP